MTRAASRANRNVSRQSQCRNASNVWGVVRSQAKFYRRQNDDMRGTLPSTLLTTGRRDGQPPSLAVVACMRRACGMQSSRRPAVADRGSEVSTLRHHAPDLRAIYELLVSLSTFKHLFDDGMEQCIAMLDQTHSQRRGADFVLPFGHSVQVS